MSSDPTRLEDTVGDELVDLRDALTEARERSPDPGWQARMTKRIEQALDEHPAEAPPEPEDARDRREPDRPPVEPDPENTIEVAAESASSEALEIAEAEVGGGLTAGLLAAGAAVAWLRRLSTRPPPDGDD